MELAVLVGGKVLGPGFGSYSDCVLLSYFFFLK